ncbi:MAG TPA: hypothetical protein VHV99_21630, partial [Paraburkholderia sp.]|nr:hypothetical protein [Paraburkholderia sp.]
PPTYWRKRLYQLLDSGHLSHAQLCTVDSLLLQIDQFEAEPVWGAALATAAAALSQPAHLASASRSG